MSQTLEQNPQLRRRRDPYPWTWEIPVAVTAAVLLVLSLGVHLGRAIANRVAGGGWLFPKRSDLFTSLPTLLRGDPAAGLTGPVGPLATPASLAAWIVAVDLLILGVLVAAVRFGLRRWGPGRMRGMASSPRLNVCSASPGCGGTPLWSGLTCTCNRAGSARTAGLGSGGGRLAPRFGA